MLCETQIKAKWNSIRSTLCLITLFLLVSPLYAQFPVTQVPFVEVPTANLGSIYEISWHPTANILAVATDTGVWIYDETLQQPDHLQAHLGAVYSVGWNPEGTRLSSGGHDETIRIWDMEPTSANYLTNIQILPVEGPVTYLAWSPSLASGRLMSKVLVELIGGSDRAFVRHRLQIWNVVSGAIELTIGDIANSAVEVVWSSDGLRVAAVGVYEAPQYRLLVWDALTGELLRASLELPNRPRSVAWHGTMNTLVFTDDTTEVLLVNANTLELVNTFNLVTERGYSLDWEPSGNRLAVGGSDGSLTIWETTTGTLLLSVTDLPEAVQDAYWNSEADKIVTLIGSSQVRIWDVAAIPSSTGTPTITPLPTRLPTLTPSVTPVASSNTG